MSNAKALETVALFLIRHNKIVEHDRTYKN